MEFLHSSEFWVAVSFVILVAALWRPAQRALATGLDERARTIRAELDEAKRLREEAERLLADYRRKQARALGEAAEIAKQAVAEAERNRRHAEAELEASLKRREQQALDRIAQSEAAAAKQVRNTAVDVALSATRALLREQVGADQTQALVDAAIAELPRRQH